MKDVAGETLDCEVFIYGADHAIGRLEHDGVIRSVGYRTARNDRRKPRAFPAAQAVIDHVVMQIRASTASSSCEPFGEHADHSIELGALEISIRVSAMDHFEHRVFGPFIRGD